MSETTDPQALPLSRTALFDWHVAHGGRMVDFAGWELPVFYDSGAIAEHELTRRSVGLFDIDHMGQVDVSGPDALVLVDRLVTSDMASLDIGTAKYGLMCRPDGGVIDDVIVYRLDELAYMVVVNAGNRVADVDWIQQHAAPLDCDVIDRSLELEMVAVQGPNAVELVDRAAGGGVATLERFTMGTFELFGREVKVARTGYTGEDGVELYIKGGVFDVWTGLLSLASERGIEAGPIGLSARDSLRFEAGYPLYGHELSLDIHPLEARLSWAVDLDGADFIGRDALRDLKEAGLSRRLESLVMNDKGVPREGSLIVDDGGTTIGEVVSGMFCPTADVFAAHAFVPIDLAKVGTELTLNIRGRSKSASVAKRPLYRLETN